MSAEPSINRLQKGNNLHSNETAYCADTGEKTCIYRIYHKDIDICVGPTAVP